MQRPEFRQCRLFLCNATSSNPLVAFGSSLAPKSHQCWRRTLTQSTLRSSVFRSPITPQLAATHLSSSVRKNSSSTSHCVAVCVSVVRLIISYSDPFAQTLLAILRFSTKHAAVYAIPTTSWATEQHMPMPTLRSSP